MPDAWDNNESIDSFVNSSDLTVTTRTGIEYDTMAGIKKKSDDQLTQQQVDFDTQQASQSDAFDTSQNNRETQFEETRQNLIPLREGANKSLI